MTLPLTLRRPAPCFRLLFLLLLLGPLLGWSQVATYPISASNNATDPLAGSGINVTVGPLSRVGVTVTSSSGNFRGSNWPTGAADNQTVAALTGSPDLGKYIEFSLTPDAGYTLSLTSISFGVGRSGSGPRRFQWRSSRDMYAAPIAAGTAGTGVTYGSGVYSITADDNANFPGNTLTLGGASFTGLTGTVTFRLYAYSAEAAGGTGGLAGNLVVNGSVNSTTSTTATLAVTQGATAYPSGGTAYTFGSQMVTTTSSPVGFTLTNSGSDPLTISNISATGDYAVSGTAPTTVAANGGTATVNVTFAPTAAGTRTGTLVITANTATSSTYTVNLTGTATPAPPTLTAISPAAVLGGATYTSITLTGSSFGTTGSTTTQVNFNGAALTPSFINSAGTSLTVALPVPSATATYPVTVTTPSGTSSPQTLTVTAPPAGFFEPFEADSKTGYDVGSVALATGSYVLDDALLGTSASDPRNNNKSARLQAGGSVTMAFSKPNGAGTITLQAANYSNDTAGRLVVEVSSNSGSTYTAYASAPTTLTATLATYTFPAGVPGNVRVRIRNSATSRINIDDLQITDYSGPACVAPTSVAAGSITASTASVSFTGSGTATSYTVTATPAVGTAVTASGTTSPIGLTGLSPNTQYDLTVTSNCAGGLSEVSTPAVSFTTDNPALNPEINVRIDGVTQSTNSTYNFGSVVINTTSVVTLTIQNLSPTDPLTVTSFNRTGSSYTNGALVLPLVIAASSSATVSVTFQPTTTGTKTGVITIGNNDQNEGSYVVNLTGVAVTPPPAPTLTTTTVTDDTLLAGIPATIVVSGSNLTGATVAFTGGTITGTPTINAGGNAITVRLTPTTAQGSPFAITATTAAGTASLPILVTTPPTGFFEPFESFYSPTNYTAADATFSTGSWTLSNVLPGNLASGDNKFNAQALRIRGGGTATMNFNKPNGLGTVSLYAANYGNNSGAAFTLAYSTDNGATYTPIAGTPTSLTNDLTLYSYVVNVPGAVRLRIGTTNMVATSNPRINVDNLLVTDFLGDLVVNTIGQSIPAGLYNNITVTNTGFGEVIGGVEVNGALLVQAGGGLTTDCTTPITGTGSFTLEAGARLSICDPAGISSSGSTGAIRVSGLRSFSPDADYEYRGTAPQVPGSGLPGQVRGLYINAPGGLTLTAPLAIAKRLALNGGQLNTANQLTLRSAASGTAAVSEDGGSISGTVTVQRYIDPTRNPGLGYRHYSSPVQSTTFADLATPGFTPRLNTAYNSSATPNQVMPFPNVFGYDEARILSSPATTYSLFDRGWFVPTGTMEQGRGYTVNIPASETVDFVGNLEFGDVNKTLTRQGGPQGGWTFLGNPYAAPLDASLLNFPAGVNSAVFIFQSTSQYQGVYRASVNGMSNSIIPVAQGFFVRATQDGVVLPMSFANTTPNAAAAEDVFQRRTTKPMVRLTLHNATRTLDDETIVYFEQGATTGFDPRYDAEKLPNSTGLNLASSTGQEPLAINGLPLLGRVAIVPLSVNTPAAGTYVLEAADLANLPATVEVTLRDALTGTRTVLKAGSSYRFTLTSYSAPGRFALEFQPASAPLATAAQALAAQVQVYPNPAAGRFQLTLPLAAKGGVATLTNALGQPVLTRALTGAETTFDVRSLAAGVYQLHLRVAGTNVVRRVVVE